MFLDLLFPNEDQGHFINTTVNNTVHALAGKATSAHIVCTKNRVQEGTKVFSEINLSPVINHHISLFRDTNFNP